MIERTCVCVCVVKKCCVSCWYNVGTGYWRLNTINVIGKSVVRERRIHYKSEESTTRSVASILNKTKNNKRKCQPFPKSCTSYFSTKKKKEKTRSEVCFLLVRYIFSFLINDARYKTRLESIKLDSLYGALNNFRNGINFRDRGRRHNCRVCDYRCF